jgi:8-oxo-dGTP diphosphatase
VTEAVRKAAGLLVANRRVLVVRARATEVYVPPGGKIEPGEGAEQALIRELGEELGIIVRADALTPFGRFRGEAASAAGRALEMEVFSVGGWSGTPAPAAEIEEIRWLGAAVPPDVKLGSVLEREILPRLREWGRIA